ncbi:lipopolysaccharide biosynthesis protein [bacterium]|jgi:O-antigen/teichoic acid export membrane protein|nr:lipopolysaccharide biosynthesis protein [bacterium]
MSLAKKSFKGAFWLGGLRVGIKIFSLLKLIILARILSPLDFGLFGMVVIPYGLLEVATEPGMNQAMIQSKKNPNKYFSSAQFIFLIRGLCLFILLFLAAPLITSFYQHDLTQAIRIIALAPLFRGFINPAIILFTKTLNYKKQFTFQLLTSVCESLATIYFAIKLKSMIALPLGVVTGALVATILSYLLVKLTTSKVSIKKIKDLYKYGRWVTLGTLASYLNDQGDDFVVSKIMGAEALGFYQNAYKISNLPTTQGASLIYQVIFPIYSKIQGSMERLRRGVVKSILITFAFSSLFGLCLYLLAPTAILYIFGQKWLPMIPALNILIIFGVTRPLISVTSAFFDSIGKPKISTTQALIKLSILALLVWPMTSNYGITGTAWSVVIAQLAVFPWFGFQLVKALNEKTD